MKNLIHLHKNVIYFYALCNMPQKNKK